MQHGTDSVPGKIAAAVAGAFLLAGLQMFHSILDSLLIFGALLEGGKQRSVISTGSARNP
jgi:hypothetical protein